MLAKPAAHNLYGLAAEFDSPEALLAAAVRIHESGVQCAEAYSPFPVKGVAEALGFRRSRLPVVVLIGGLLGGAAAFFMQWYASVIHLPWNIGGRPPNSWPAFIPITFEMAVLGAALSAVFGMLALNKLPQPYHPLFNLDRFQLASRDCFFICIEADDPAFDPVETRSFLEALHPIAVMEVPR